MAESPGKMCWRCFFQLLHNASENMPRSRHDFVRPLPFLALLSFPYDIMILSCHFVCRCIGILTEGRIQIPVHSLYTPVSSDRPGQRINPAWQTADKVPVFLAFPPTDCPKTLFSGIKKSANSPATFPIPLNRKSGWGVCQSGIL